MPKPGSARGRISSVSVPAFLTNSFIVDTVKEATEDTTTFINFLSALTDFAQKNPRATRPCLSNATVVEAFAELLSRNNLPDTILIPFLKTIACIFPLLDKVYTEFVDAGLIFSLYNTMQEDNAEVVLNTIALIEIMATYSSYARDSLIGLEIHFNLVDIAKSSNYPELIVVYATSAIYHIFANREPMETDILINALPKIVGLLELDNKQCLINVIMTLVEMTNKYCYLVINLFEKGLFPLFVSYLDDEDLYASGLCLIGNCCVGNPSQVNTLLQEGILQKLLVFMQNGKTPDAFWVMSNLIEAAHTTLLPLINDELITMIVNIASSSSFEMKKEASYLLLTIIINSNESNLKGFITEEIMDTFADMLSCGVEKVVIRCINTLVKLVAAASKDASIANNLLMYASSSDLSSCLSDVIDQEGYSKDITQTAEFLLNQITKYQRHS